MNDEQKTRRYMDYDEVDPALKDCLVACWGQCSKCGCRVFPIQMRLFAYDGEVYFEGDCPACGITDDLAYNDID